MSTALAILAGAAFYVACLVFAARFSLLGLCGAVVFTAAALVVL